jgi:hypothetical protein
LSASAGGGISCLAKIVLAPFVLRNVFPSALAEPTRSICGRDLSTDNPRQQ